jgi:heavy metal sensor kinase
VRSLRFRLTLWFGLAVTFTAAAAAWLGSLVLERQMIAGLDFLLVAETKEVLARLPASRPGLDGAALVEALRAHTEIDAPLYFFQVRRIGHGVLFRSRNLGESSLPDIAETERGADTVLLNGERIRRCVVREGDLLVEVATSQEQADELLARFAHMVWLGLPLLLLGSVGAGWLLSSVALHPVRAMQRSAQRISASNLAERLPVPPGHDEIAALARLLNELFARLEASFEQVKRFTADASHELKTPLSLIRLHAERLGQSPRLAEADRAELEGQIEEITRLNKLVESLLLLAKADAGSLRLDRRLENPATFFEEFAEDAAALAEDAGRRVEVAMNEPGAVFFDPALVRQVLLNLLSNAVRHTPAGGAIVLSSRIDRESWRFAIEDEGPGVPPDHLERIFERFVRGPGAEARAPGGSGLGLAIARSIVEAHGGTIHAELRAEGGLRVIVRMPSAPIPDGRT